MVVRKSKGSTGTSMVVRRRNIKRLMQEIEEDLKRVKDTQINLRRKIDKIHFISRRRRIWIQEVAISHVLLVLAGMIIFRSVPLFLAYCACVLFSNWYLLNKTIDKVGKY
jgi:hypothetical protein